MHGIMAIVMPAWSMPQSVPPRLVSARAVARISGRVNVEALLNRTSAAEELVPRRDEGEQRDRDDRRHDGRDEDRAQDLPRVAAVGERGLLELAWDRLEAVAHDVQAERQLDRGMDDGQPDQRVGQLDGMGEHQEDRRQQRLVRDDQRQQQEDEDELLARDREAGQRVAGGDRQRERERDRHERRREAVEEVGRQTGLVRTTIAGRSPG